jgi:hypothetical protein
MSTTLDRSQAAPACHCWCHQDAELAGDLDGAHCLSCGCLTEIGAAGQALAELRQRRAEGHAKGCSCSTREPIAPGRPVGGCRALRALALAVGWWEEIQ